MIKYMRGTNRGTDKAVQVDKLFKELKDAYKPVSNRTQIEKNKLCHDFG